MASNNIDQETQPLLQDSSSQNASNQAFKSVADLAKHLPTATVLAFQVLSPAFTNAGKCTDVNKIITAILLLVSGLSCFILAFTDSFKDPATQRIRYGIATCGGICVFDELEPLEPSEAYRYRIKPLDFVHGFISVLIFAGVALLDTNVVACYSLTESDDVKQVITMVPIAIGVVGSLLIVTYPNTRNMIGFPAST